VLARLCDVGRVAIEALDEVTTSGVERSGQAAIATAEMDHQPTADTGGLEYPSGGRLRGGGPGRPLATAN